MVSGLDCVRTFLHFFGLGLFGAKLIEVFEVPIQHVGLDLQLEQNLLIDSRLGLLLSLTFLALLLFLLRHLLENLGLFGFRFPLLFFILSFDA